MSYTSLSTPGNTLLMNLPGPARRQLLANGELRQLSHGPALAIAGHAQGDVLFPVTCVLAAMTPGASTPALALLLVTREGMLGASLCLDVLATPYSASILLPGTAWCIGRTDFLRQLENSALLQGTAKRQVFLQSLQIATTAACAHFHDLEARLAFWLLMIEGATLEGSFHATHLRLAQLLGVQRAAVSIAASRLRERGAIQYSRGQVQVVCRDRLEDSACRCYRETVNEQQRPLR